MTFWVEFSFQKGIRENTDRKSIQSVRSTVKSMLSYREENGAYADIYPSKNAIRPVGRIRTERLPKSGLYAYIWRAPGAKKDYLVRNNGELIEI